MRIVCWTPNAADTHSEFRPANAIAAQPKKGPFRVNIAIELKYLTIPADNNGTWRGVSWLRSVAVLVTFFSWIVVLTSKDNFWAVPVMHSVSYTRKYTLLLFHDNKSLPVCASMLHLYIQCLICFQWRRASLSNRTVPPDGRQRSNSRCSVSPRVRCPGVFIQRTTTAIGFGSHRIWRWWEQFPLTRGRTSTSNKHVLHSTHTL